MRIFTPNLHVFFITWYLQPSQFPDGILGQEEFLADRFIEDVMDGRQSIALVIEEVRIPMGFDQHAFKDIGVTFKVLTTEEQAIELKELGYRVTPEKPDDMKILVWDDEPEGMTWKDFTSILRGTLPVSDEKAWDQEVRATDDNDPNAPWFRVMGIKHDDDGIFLALEEIDL